MTLGDVIAKYRAEHKMSMDKFASLSGISKGYISMLERNQTQRGEEPSPSIDMYKSVARVAGIDVDELIRMVEGNVALAPAATGLELSDIPLVKFPVVGSIAAGYGCCAVEEYTGNYAYFSADELSAPAEEYFVLRIRGDSMYPKLLDGDYVLVRRKSSVDSGKIAVVLYDGEDATVKKVNYVSGEDWLELVPINPEYQKKRIEGVDLEQCRVLGEVVKLQRDL